MTNDDTPEQECAGKDVLEGNLADCLGIERWLRPARVAELFQVSKRTVFRWISDPGSTVVTRKPSPGVLLISRDSLAQFIDASDAK